MRRLCMLTVWIVLCSWCSFVHLHEDQSLVPAVEYLVSIVHFISQFEGISNLAPRKLLRPTPIIAVVNSIWDGSILVMAANKVGNNDNRSNSDIRHKLDFKAIDDDHSRLVHELVTKMDQPPGAGSRGHVRNKSVTKSARPRSSTKGPLDLTEYEVPHLSDY
jgi:hypothetical protein